MTSRKTLATLWLTLAGWIEPKLVSYFLRSRSAVRRVDAVSVQLRLLYVSATLYPYHVSGYSTRTLSVVSAMERNGTSVTVCARPGYPWDRRDSLSVPKAESGFVSDLGQYHFRKPTRYRPIFMFMLQGSKVIERLAIEVSATVIHAASNHANALPALLAARNLGLPFHYEMRGLWEITRVAKHPEFEGSAGYRLGLSLEALVARSADRVYVISQAMGRYITERWDIDPLKIALLPNCVDDALVVSEDGPLVEPMTIGYAGSLLEYEGLDTLIDAVHVLRRQDMKVNVRIVGDGPMRPALMSQVSRFELEGAVEFLGRKDPTEVRGILRKCAMVCIPRKPYEVCKIVPPIKLVEALALGKAVVVPDLPVFRDELGSEPPALFFRSGDHLDLARVIAESLANPSKLNDLGKKAQRYVAEQRTWKKFLDAPCRDVF